MRETSARTLFPAAILLVGINLRPALASVGPLLDAIQRDTGLGDIGASLLTTFPVLLMGICLLGTAWLRGWMGGRAGIASGVLLILVACLARWVWPQAVALVLTAIVGGVGIAIVQALMPGVIRRRAGARSGRLMGFYSTAIMGGALISSTACAWIGQVWGWPIALGIWALPALLGLGIWLLVAQAPQEFVRSVQRRSVHHAPRAWLLMLFFGLGTGAYTLVLAWLPPFYTQLGWSEQAAGAMLGAVTLAEVVAGIAVSLWVDRSPDRRAVLFTAIAALLAGMLCLCVAPLQLAWAAALLAGLGIGALFPLSLIVAMDHGEDADQASAIAGFVQGGGYVLAAALPLVAGLLRQQLADLTPAWWLMAGLCLALALIAARFRPGDRLFLPR
jgi:MFS transporter, CP family, cyanate transporter